MSYGTEVGACLSGGKLIMEEEDGEKEEQRYEEEGETGYVDYFAPMSHLTCTGHDRFPFTKLCVCVCVREISMSTHEKLWPVNK